MMVMMSVSRTCSAIMLSTGAHSYKHGMVSESFFKNSKICKTSCLLCTIKADQQSCLIYLRTATEAPTRRVASYSVPGAGLGAEDLQPISGQYYSVLLQLWTNQSSVLLRLWTNQSSVLLRLWTNQISVLLQL